MFIALACDFGNEDTRIKADRLLQEYGFRKVQRNLYETNTLNDKNLARLKLELDRMTDHYDSLRFYQYPVEDTLVVTALEEKRWKRMLLKT